MRWLDRISRSDADAAGGASDATMIKGDDSRGSRRVAGTPAVYDAPDPPLSEEIKRRQLALLLHYVTTIHAR
jgi:hypothetical protein